MIKAMESGTGSISTTHAADAVAAVRKLVTCAMEAGPHVTQGLATSKLAATVDLIVQLSMETKVAPGGAQRTRRVAEVIALAPGEKEPGYATTHVFRADASGIAAPDVLPDEYRRARPARLRPGGLPRQPTAGSAAMTALIPAPRRWTRSPSGSSASSSACARQPCHRGSPPDARRRRGPTRRTRLLLLAGAALGLVGWLITGWILALVIAPIAVIGLPILLSRPAGRHADRAPRSDGGMDSIALRGAHRRHRPRAGTGRNAAIDTRADRR